MIIDIRNYQHHHITSEICILGGGVAGITIALELARLEIDCVIVESGGLRPDSRTRDLYRGDSNGLAYDFADGCRSRYLGGSSNCWGGWCRPFGEDDFEKRPWMPNSGWPIEHADFIRFQERAHALLKLGPPNYDLHEAIASLKSEHIREIIEEDKNVEELMVRFSPPVRMGRDYYKELEHSPHIRVFLFGNAVNVRCTPSREKVSHVNVQTLCSRKFTFSACHYVLAMGGIENARLLLSSREDYSGGIGNHHDLVGRYFMDHPRATLGHFKKTPHWQKNYLFDLKYQYHNTQLTHRGNCIAGVFRLTKPVREREHLNNAFAWLVTDFDFEHSPTVDALRALKSYKANDALDCRTLVRLLARAAAAPHNLLAFAIGRKFRPLSWSKRVAIQVVCEPTPDRESRVRLGVRLDELGMQRAVVNWVVGEPERATIGRTFDIVAESLRKHGLEMISGRPDHDTEINLEGTWHHMGTTRMDNHPAHGVVDGACKVHGLHNFFVAGSSTFPTGGANFPTINIVAMALRLAETLAKKLRTTALLGEDAHTNCASIRGCNK